MMPRFKATDTSNVRLVEKVYLDGVQGTEKPVNPNREVSCILVSVTQGAVDIFLGGARAGRRVPDLHYGQTNKPEWTPIPCGMYEFTLVAAGNPGQPILACVWFGGPD
jgi:hypothetical protein